MCVWMALFSPAKPLFLPESILRWSTGCHTNASSPALLFMVIPLVIIAATKGVNPFVRAAIKDGFHKELNSGMSVLILDVNQNGNEERWPFIVCLNQAKQAQFGVLKPLKKSHLTSGYSTVLLIIQTEMKVSCLCFSLVNDAPVPLCNSKSITLWDLKYFQKIIPINTADVFSAANEAMREGALDTAPCTQ